MASLKALQQINESQLRLLRATLATLQYCQFEIDCGAVLSRRQTKDLRTLRQMCAEALVGPGRELSIDDVGQIQDAVASAGLEPPAGGWPFFHGQPPRTTQSSDDVMVPAGPAIADSLRGTYWAES